MANKEQQKENNKTSTFSIAFEDGSQFVLPPAWEDVFQKYFGKDPVFYPWVEQQIRFIAKKYFEHQAWPSKFDGLCLSEEELKDDKKFDDLRYYTEGWDERKLFFNDEETKPNKTPSLADIAHDVLYQAMRVGLMQKTLDDYAKEKGTKPIRVVTPEDFLRTLEEQVK